MSFFFAIKKSARAFVQNVSLLVEARRVGPLRKEACQIPPRCYAIGPRSNARTTPLLKFAHQGSVKIYKPRSQAMSKSGLPSARTPSPILP